MKKINPIVKMLQLSLFRGRVVPNKKKYNRKKEKQKNVLHDPRRRDNS